MKRYRIEFDSISDVPDMYVDGVNVREKPNGLISLKLNWKTDGGDIPRKRLMVKYFDAKEKKPLVKTIGEQNY